MNSLQLLPQFLTQDLCKTLIDSYKDRVASSTVILSNSTLAKDSSRTSSTYYIPNTDPHIPELRQKVADFLQIPTTHIEGIQFLRYLHGEQYKYHHDFLPGNPPNQRVHTILVYLNTLAPEEGGATSFFHYNTKVQPEEGLAVWFRNTDEQGALITQSLHAGEPILKPGAVKYALNIWTKQHPV
jgi:prolyl 4-hydroxylase